MNLTVAAARELARASLAQLGYSDADTQIIVAHLMDCELRGLGYSGLARILSIAERLAATPRPARPITVVKESAVSARLDGGDQLGYLVAQRSTLLAIDKASSAGIAIVGASDTWYTGMLSYYAEMAVARDLVVMLASNASPWVAPHGGTEGRFGTNPICFGFPSNGQPVIWDIGTSSIIHAQVKLAERIGDALPAGVAFDAAGHETRDPSAALAGALASWGGHKGSGLAVVVHLLGMLAGSPMMPGELRDFGFLAIAVRPDLLTSLDDYKAAVDGYADVIHATRPVENGAPVRMPFERSIAERAARIAADRLEIADEVVSALRALGGR
ncbi:Ldh family oxidoreductase [Paraburkholderia sp. ZP32-5]|uniref:Ldh family oxidoreductase n=1 Tax=Paraburkholderia sp. ZP32-5 TaxID=2883245 RepID=UPI001F415FF9|nr:Ldh family oxidoreductase [Paraburkholderia sp. ZP32-5]